MVDLNKIIVFFTVVNWRRIFQFFVFLFTVGMSVAVWENRVLIYSSVLPGKISASNVHIVNVSDDTKIHIKDVLEKFRNVISAIHITSVDFQKNTRKVIYFESENQEINEIFENYSQGRLADLPFFNQDPNNNKRMIGLINGEFVCSKYVDTTAGKVAPEGSRFVEHLCLIGIPPYYGKFSGYVAVHLQKEPTPAELAELRIIARDISLAVYENDIKK